MALKYEHIVEAADFISKQIAVRPVLALILGSGLGGVADRIDKACVWPYSDIPHFPVSTVTGHAGRLVCGTLEGREVVALQGRFHYYEGYSVEQVTLPVRVMQVLGIKRLLVTNAVGGINTCFVPGDLVLIRDHINLTGVNPLSGPNDERLGVRFPDMSRAYCPVWREQAARVMADMGMEAREGVYAGLGGPSYETPAEIRYLRCIGADMVGMSTVHEVIAANHGGMRVLGISCITNMAAGVRDEKMCHEDVMAVADQIAETFCGLVGRIVACPA
jgi:purine-nucleoside phosphorylase